MMTEVVKNNLWAASNINWGAYLHMFSNHFSHYTGTNEKHMTLYCRVRKRRGTNNDPRASGNGKREVIAAKFFLKDRDSNNTFYSRLSQDLCI